MHVVAATSLTRFSTTLAGTLYFCSTVDGEHVGGRGVGVVAPTTRYYHESCICAVIGLAKRTPPNRTAITTRRRRLVQGLDQSTCKPFGRAGDCDLAVADAGVV